MTSRAEVTTRYAKAYMKASKKDKGRILDQVVEVTCWSRDNARRRLTAAAKRSPGLCRSVAKRPRKPRAAKYSYDALKVLQRVWAASGGQCGKYLAASMALQLDGLQRHDELAFGRDRYSPAVRAELLEMSAATIDRYLASAKARDQISGVSTTKPSPLLRNSVKVRKAGDEVEDEPGFFEGDTVAHCGPTLKGEFARTLNLTDVHTGWVFTRTVRNNANTHILSALKAGVQEIPYEVTGLDFDNGTEFLNKAVIKWAGEMEIFFTRSRPYKKNDQATIESKNNHLVSVTWNLAAVKISSLRYDHELRRPVGHGSAGGEVAGPRPTRAGGHLAAHVGRSWACVPDDGRLRTGAGGVPGDVRAGGSRSAQR